jgi:MoxR-like ATPase
MNPNDFSPHICHIETHLNAYPSKKKKNGIKVEMSKEISKCKRLNSIHSLTLSQGHCLLFLMTSILTRQAYIIEGAMSSGKSHLVRLFARLLGRELLILQLNQESGISSLTGQFTPKFQLSNEASKEIFNSIKEFCRI